MPATVWTAARLRILKGLVKDGALVCTREQAAILCGVSGTAVTTYCASHGIKPKCPKTWTPEHQKRFQAFVRNGRLTAPVNIIAKTIGVPANIVFGQAHHQRILTLNNKHDAARRVIAGVLALSREAFLTVPEDLAAALIRCSRHAVDDARARLALAPMAEGPERKALARFWTVPRLRALRAILDERGKFTVSQKVAAVRLGCDREQLRPFFLAMRVETRRAVFLWTTARKQALRALCRDDVLTLTTREAASRMACSIGQLRAGLKLIGATPTPKHVWSPQRLSKLRTLLNGHGHLSMTRKQACVVMGCNRKSLQLGLVLLRNPAYARFAWTPARIAQLRALAKDGVLQHDLTEVMTRLGCSEKVLRRAMKNLGIHARPRFSWTPDAEHKLASLRRADGKLTVTYEEAARLIGCSPRSIDYKMTRDRPGGR